MALAERTLDLVNIPSESGEELELYSYITSVVALEQAYSRRRVGDLRQTERQTARPPRGPHRHRAVPGEPARPDRGRVGRGPRGQRHEGRARRDDRARQLGGDHRARLRPRIALLPARGARPRGEPAPRRLRAHRPGRRGAAGRLPRAHGQLAAARVSRQPERERRLRRTLRTFRAPVAGRERHRGRLRGAGAGPSTPSRATSRSRACCSAR